MQPIDEDMARALHRGDKRDGVLVNQVQPDSPAARAGLQVGDIITAINGQPCMRRATSARSVGTTQPNHEVHLTVLRDGRERQVTATVASNPQTQQAAAEGRSGAASEGQVGLALRAAVARRAPAPGHRSRRPGCGRRAGAAAQPRRGKRPQAGDVILRIGSTAVDYAVGGGRAAARGADREAGRRSGPRDA
jgi:serine protease Do